MSNSNPRIGIDLGGTKIEAILLGENGEIRARERIPTPKDDYEAILNCIKTLTENLSANLSDNPYTPIGIGTPGSISRVTSLMRNSNSTCLNGKPLQADLEALLNRPIRMANDANCFALSEASDGAAADCSVVFGVILGTGVGGGICVNGTIIEGINGIGGEWGHNPMPRTIELENPRSCFCGKHDCVETWLSGSGLSASYFSESGESLAAEKIAALYNEGHNIATAVINRYSRQLAAALATVINVVDPDAIVLGGGISNIKPLIELVPSYLPEFVFSDQVDTKILQAMHGDSSGVRGAAWLNE